MQNKLKTLDQYNLFDLMGLANMTSSQKEAMLIDINTSIWNDFIDQNLMLMLTQDQMQVIKNKLIKNEEVEKILKYVAKIVPNIFNLMDEFARQFKFNYIKDHFLLMLDEYSRMATLLQDSTNIQQNEQERNKYLQAIKLLDNYQWAQLLQLFAGKQGRV